MERANKECNARYCEQLIATNPCAEQPLPAYGSCLPGSLNLAKFAINGDWRLGELGGVAAVAVNFLDNVIDRALYPLP